MELEVADRGLPNQGKLGRGIMVTPPIDEDYWYWRVKLGEKEQAIVGFPKFNTIGIGFAQEGDWNSNLPYACTPEKILAHIQHNKGGEISDEDCLAAIAMVREAARQFKGLSDDEWAAKQAHVA